MRAFPWARSRGSPIDYEDIAGNIAGRMNAISNCGAGLQFDECQCESPSPAGSSSSREGCSSSRSTATSRLVKFRQIPRCVYFSEMDLFKAFQDRLRQANVILPHNSPVESQMHTFSQEMSQHPHVLSNDEFMALLNSPPSRQVHPSSDQRASFLSLPNSFPQPSLSPDLQPPTGRTPIFPDSQPPIGRAPILLDSQPPIGRAPILPDSQPPIQTSPHQGSSEQVVQGNPPPAEKPASKKRGSTKKPTKKAKKGKSKTASDDDSDGDDGGSTRWIDAEVSQLIAFRNEMDDEFRANAKKQGKNTWDKLQGRMIASCEKFAKSSAACRKKWDALYCQYCTDKRILQISGEGRKITCRFFEEIDQGFNNLANVRKVVHGDADGSPNVYPPDLNEPIEGQGSRGNVTAERAPNPTSDPTRPSTLSPQASNAPKKSNGEQISSLMTAMISQTKEMVNQGSQMVVQTKSMATDIHDNTSVLKELRLDLARLIEKL